MSVTAVRILSNPENPYMLGRSVEHDERSRRFALNDIPAAQWKDKEWKRYVPILNQQDLLAQGIHLDGNYDALSSCTGNAGIGAIGSSPYWMRQLPTLRRVLRDSTSAEIHAIDLYAEATELDEFPETWPPQDMGSSALGVAKALVKQGMISGYDHSFTGLNGLISALQTGPVMFGVNWYESMFSTNPNGTLEISGAVAGGHQLVIDALYLEQRMVRFPNSWGPAWGDGGCGFLTFDQVDRLANEQGDILTFRV